MERNSKLLSVIVPVYKAEKYLHRCVDSIIAQTWSNLEIILVDDGSPDNSGAICDEYAARDSRIRVIHKPNGGVSSARNAGIDAATGEYIAFVDSDDYIAPDMYEKLFGVLKSEKSIAACDFMMDYGGGNLFHKTTVAGGASNIEALKALYMSDVGGGSVYMIIPKSLLKEFRFPLYINNGEDLWLVTRLFAKTESLCKTNLPLYFYNRENESSLTHVMTYRNALECIRGYEESYDFLNAEGLFEAIEKEWSWYVLRFKSVFVTNREHFAVFRESLPFVNRKIVGCPFLSFKMKIVMLLVEYRLDSIASFLISLKTKNK